MAFLLSIVLPLISTPVSSKCWCQVCHTVLFFTQGNCLPNSSSSPCRQLYPRCCWSLWPSVPDPHLINSCGNSDHSFIENTKSGGPEPYAIHCSKNGTIPGVISIPENCENPIIEKCTRITADILPAPYTRSKWIWLNNQVCSVGYWLPGLHQSINSAGQRVTVKAAQIMDQESCKTEISGYSFDLCFVI